MIQVIKHGDRIHTYKCLRCQCVFTAHTSDIKRCGNAKYISCPECGNYVHGDTYIPKNSSQYRIFNKYIKVIDNNK